MRTREDFAGLEYDWLAVDEKGNVGFFSTAGGGALPDGFISDPELYEHALDTLLSMAPSTEARCWRALPEHLQDTWRLMAERGLFAYDSDPNGGPYRLIASPQQPVTLEQLPAPVRQAGQRTRLQGVRLGGDREIANATVLDALRY